MKTFPEASQDIRSLRSHGVSPSAAMLTALASLALAATAAQASFTATGVYDEQTIQANAVDFSMGYSANATWTTGIGQTLGASQILDLSTFQTLVEGAFLAGNGGVIDFDNGGTLDSSTSFNVSFDSGNKSLGFTNRPANGGSYSLGTSTSNRTPISGDTYLGRSSNPHFDFELTELAGFAAGEKVTTLGVSLLGRNGGSTGNSNWRVIGYYTDGVNTGSSSTFRSIDTAAGNTSADSFSGIVAPDGWWITRFRVHSDNNVFTSIDDIGFVTAIVPEPSAAALGLLGGVGLFWRRLRSSRRL